LVSDLKISAVCAEVDGNERGPDDAGRVHRKGDVLCLVEVLRNVASLERVHSAQSNQHHVVHERHDDRQVGGLAA